MDLRNVDGPSGELSGEAKTFILERTVELDAGLSKGTADQGDNNIVEAFLNHPDCLIVLKAVVNALTSLPTTILVAGAAAAAGAPTPAVASVIVPLSVGFNFRIVDHR